MVELKFYNTLTKKKEVFKPIQSGKVGMYSCGPTVYWYQHIGNLRSYIFADLVKRVLLYNGFKVKHVINVTDVGHLTSDEDEGEDKMEKAAKNSLFLKCSNCNKYFFSGISAQKGSTKLVDNYHQCRFCGTINKAHSNEEYLTVKEIADFYFSIFKKDLAKVNVLMPDFWPRASEHIKEQIALIEKLEKKGFTYKTSDGIYFDSSKFKDYGKLAKLKVEGLESGKRISEKEKKNKTDFALWKFSSGTKRQQEWESPWSVGFPGWHLECSAMSMKYLGEHFDIHTGGEEHIPVHHTNEIAQSECATGKKFVNYWLHGRWLMSKGEKMSKSKGGIFTLSELEEKNYNPLEFRYLCLLTQYRKPLNFELETLDAAKNAYKKLKRKVSELRNEKHKGQDFTEEYEEKFLNAINDDLNLPRAMDVVWTMLDDFNFDPKKKIALLEKFDLVLGLGIKEMKEEADVPKEITELVREREKLRKAKMWREADILRERIRELGFVIEDGENGARVEKI